MSDLINAIVVVILVVDVEEVEDLRGVDVVINTDNMEDMAEAVVLEAELIIVDTMELKGIILIIIIRQGINRMVDRQQEEDFEVVEDEDHIVVVREEILILTVKDVVEQWLQQ